jgi:hypothetical protein
MSKEKRPTNASVAANQQKKISTLSNPTGGDKKKHSNSSAQSPLASLKQRAAKKDPQEVFEILEIIGKGCVFTFFSSLY